MDSGNKKSPEEAKTVAARRGAAINLKSGPQRPLVITLCQAQLKSTLDESKYNGNVS